MAAFNKFRQFVEDLAHKVHNLATSADTLKVMLSNTTPVNTNAVLADITEIGTGNGYSAGGTAATISSSAQTTGTFKMVCSNVVFTASGGTIGALRYVVLYNSTPTSPLKPLIGWWDYGSSITLNDGETLTVSFDATNGVLTIA
jgi:hypothetical protein